MADSSIAFGPVASRRLGHSLGINNIPPKRCSYSCLYCQVGHTPRPEIERQRFYEPERIAREVNARLAELRARGEPVDHLAFVPEGEPTLDARLGRVIELLRPLGVKIAVITNGSLLGRDDVRADLALADWVSLKIDTVDAQQWRRLNRPAGVLELGPVLDGMLRFASEFVGELVTDTMLVRGINDAEDDVGATAAFVSRLRPLRAYLGIPTRPTADPHSAAPDEERFERGLRRFASSVPVVEALTGYGEADYGSTGDAAHDLSAIVAVHPMRHDEVDRYLRRVGAGWEAVERLVRAGEIQRVEHRGHPFYVRRWER
jgi:wyosine [tRNA(Phe)-imidazoG37] synthetase (radical SAM superfamily)